MRALLNRFLRRTWSLFFVVFCVGVPSAIVVDVISSQSLLDIANLTLRDDVRGSLFGALVSAAGFLLAIMLAVLAVITTLDGKPIMVRWQEAKHSYERLIDAVLGPVFTTLAMGAFTIICIALPSSTASSRSSMAFVSIALGLSIAAFAQAGYVGWMLGRLLLTQATHTREQQNAPNPDTEEASYVRIDTPASEPDPKREQEKPPPGRRKRSGRAGMKHSRLALR